MSNPPVFRLSNPPDLLRRFVPLPYGFCVHTESLHLHFTTNESRLADTLASITGECAGNGPKIKCTLLCDSDLSPELGDQNIVETDTSVFLTFERACVIAIDRKNREITGFIAADLLKGAWPAIVLPALMAMIVETL